MRIPPLDLGPLLLRPWRDEDVDAVLAGQGRDPASRLWAGGGALDTREDAVALVDRLRTEENRASWAVVDAATGELLGSVTVHSIDLRQGDAQVGYWTAAPARGRGVAPRAVDAACRWVFGTLAVDRIGLCHAVENATSGRVAEKAGFTLEGRLRRSFRYGDGVKHDELLWSRLSDDPAPALG
ncbi:GNAT family N-acetyltransferase [Blastococcus atacamensis]|uniref:GNAT family N-acetyltransferase n=1 Tax=Blastococcus atacamensis TaxID=2070508 RepID=UPI001E5ACB54|nr:GNAT family protein [Blastococcus atacamensis]